MGSIELFGDVKEASKAGMKHIMYENFMLAAKLAEKQGDYKSMISALAKASALFNLFDSDFQFLDPSEFLKPAKVTFTDHPSALLNPDDAEEIDFEEIDDLKEIHKLIEGEENE